MTQQHNSLPSGNVTNTAMMHHLLTYDRVHHVTVNFSPGTEEKEKGTGGHPSHMNMFQKCNHKGLTNSSRYGRSVIYILEDLRCFLVCVFECLCLCVWECVARIWSLPSHPMAKRENYIFCFKDKPFQLTADIAIDSWVLCAEYWCTGCCFTAIKCVTFA